MSVYLIRRYISALPRHQLFASRELLHLSSRSSVDNTLSCLVSDGYIFRLARGVYIREIPSCGLPSAAAIARCKASAFKKQIVIQEGSMNEFFIAGHRSSFVYNKERIVFKSIGQRKVALGDNRVGDAVRQLWSVGEYDMSKARFIEIMSPLSIRERQEVRSVINSLPAWLCKWIDAGVLPGFELRISALKELREHKGSWQSS